MKTAKATAPAPASRLPVQMALCGLAAVGALGLWSIYRSVAPSVDSAKSAPSASPGGRAGLVPWTPGGQRAPVHHYGPEHPLYEGPPRGSPDAPTLDKVIAAQVEESLTAEPASQALDSLGLVVMRDATGKIAGISGSVPYEWNRAGVQHSDLITHVDGVPVAHLLAVPASVVRLAAMKNGKLTIERVGQRTTVQVGNAALTPAERLRQIRERQQQRQLYGR